MTRPTKKLMDIPDPVPIAKKAVTRGGRKTVKRDPYEVIITIREDDFEICESGEPPVDFDSEQFLDDIDELLAAEG